MAAELDVHVIEALCQSDASRDQQRLLLEAAGSAAMAGRDQIRLTDLGTPPRSRERRMGFT